MREVFECGELREYGQDFPKILPPLPLFGSGATLYMQKKQSVLEKLRRFFDCFKDLGIKEENV